MINIRVSEPGSYPKTCLGSSGRAYVDIGVERNIILILLLSVSSVSICGKKTLLLISVAVLI
jgi:hypothetical protein